MSARQPASPPAGTIEAVSADETHGPGKRNRLSILLVEGQGVEGDAHYGATIQHLSRTEHSGGEPNLRQVHLIGVELLDELNEAGFDVAPGTLGENVTTRGISLLELPVGTRLRLGSEAVVELTGLRNPCSQLDGLQPGLMKATLDRDTDGNLIRRAGLRAVVRAGGEVRPGEPVEAELPAGAPRPLLPV
jgi:MOSC domain-containing protein YiiM